MFKEFAPQMPPWLQNTLDNMQRLPQYRLRVLLLFSSLVAIFNTLFFYLEPQSHVRPVDNFYLIFGFLFLMGVAMIFKATTLASHLFVTTCFLFLNTIAWLNGGINSPNIAWMPLIAIIALMMFGWRWAVFWLVMILISQFLQFMAVDQGWINGVVLPSNSSVQQTLLSRLNVLFLLVLATALYDGMFSFKRREMALHNAQLEATQAALLAAQSHKDEFIASVGHELRTPMNAILGLNGVLLNELSDQTAQQAIAQHIRDSTEQLLSVVNDILDISQLEAAGVHFHPTPCQLLALVQQSVERIQASVNAKGLLLELHVDDQLPEWVLMDQQRLTQVLNHLLGNAVKFTTVGRIGLHLSTRPQVLRFEIEDTGIGIPAERLQHVFSRFEHADLDTHRNYGGTGLGLAICERLISRQGGQIGLSSQQHVGTRVWFELPMRLASVPSIPATSTSINTQRHFKVLLVDDNDMNLLVADLMLKTAWRSVQVEKVTSGAHALSVLSQESFDLVLMDMVMPDMDGIETTQRLRLLPGLAHLPVIGLTANNLVQDIEKCLAAGMNHVLMKPIDAKLLYQTIDHLLDATHHG